MLRGLLAHKLRLVLSSLAVVLGTMFMAGAFIGGDTVAQGFQELFTTINTSVDVQVTAKDTAPGAARSGRPAAFVDEQALARIRGVPGADQVTPQVIADGARVVGKDGKVIGSSGPPRFGAGWVTQPGSLIELRAGRPPAADDEIVIDAGLARTSGYGIGDRVDVITLQPRQTFTVVGIVGYQGGRDSLGGETTVIFTTARAQELMLGAPGQYTSVEVHAQPGVSPATLRDRIAAALGPGYETQTGAEAAKASAASVQGFVGILKTGLAVFALIGLFTGAFLIFNTFSMLVAQRTRELALYRSFGASRGQVNRSVLAEAVLLGAVSAVIGLGLGLLVGWLLKTLLTSFSHVDLPVSGVVVRPYVVVVTLLVGIGFTVAAALVPSLRASRVSPLAAMRDAATPDRPLRRLTIAGALVLALGVVLLALKLTGTVKGQNALLLGGGAAVAFLGVAMLAPVISRPVTAVIGRVFGTGVAGRLGVRNTGRNPRRTAVTAAALMIGVALATGAGVFAASVKAGISDVFRSDLHAQLAVTTDPGGSQLAGFPVDATSRITAIPGVASAVAVQADIVELNGAQQSAAATDLTSAKIIFGMVAAGGRLDPLSAGEFVVDARYAKDHGLSLGQTVPLRTARGGASTVRLVGVYADNKVVSGPLLSPADAAGFRSPAAQAGYVQVAPGASVDEVHQALDALFADNPEVTVLTTDAVVKQASRFLDIVLAILNVLLGLTILVAVLGVINTLLLSVFERTREIGLIRAIGMRRGQLARMITVESILISVFGALLGIAAGIAIGLAIIFALRGSSNGIIVLTIPWSYLVITMLLAVVAGAVAAILPAIRATRLPVLDAIAYE